MIQVYDGDGIDHGNDRYLIASPSCQDPRKTVYLSFCKDATWLWGFDRGAATEVTSEAGQAFLQMYTEDDNTKNQQKIHKPYLVPA